MRMNMMTIDISAATQTDIDALYALRKKHGVSGNGYFERCLQEQAEKKRSLFVLRNNGGIAGYAHIVWQPSYAPFKRFDIPEIEDVLIDPDRRGQGLGKALLAFCENEIRKAGKTEAGLGVGLHGAYGPAQRLYIQSGYLPDGNGIVYESTPVKGGEIRPVDDFLCLKLTKKLL